MTSNFGTKYGKCRCCSVGGHHRDLRKEYCWNGIREVYSDMFVECFNLRLSPKANLTTLICNPCVSRLRDANSFRFLVASTEQQLLDALEPGRNEDVVVNIKGDDDTTVEVKMESCDDVKVEPWVSERIEDDWHDDNEEIFEDQLSVPLSEQLVEGEAALLARAAPRPLPTRDRLRVICKQFFRHLEALEGKQILGKTLENLLKPKKVREKRTGPAKNEPNENSITERDIIDVVNRIKSAFQIIRL